jgi:glycosyltransferase involved in cell wall biosynthesis
MKTVNWRALANLKADGYSYASSNLSSRLRDLGALSLDDFYNTNVKAVTFSDSGELNLLPVKDSADILINNCLPPEYSFDAEYVVGFTYWETTQLPNKWVNYMNRCDEVWTTSRWAKDVFISSGVKVPVFAFDLGINTEAFKYNRKPRSGPFTFIHVGSPSTRKNTQLVVDAFHKLFNYSTDYKLIIKSNGPPDARHIVDGHNFGSLYGKRTIEIIDYYLSDSELGDLFGRSDCLVYPTRGEGWGMAPFQAIATGLPTICSNATACTEFASLSVPLEADYADTNQFGIYETGKWADPKIDDVCDKMLYVINNYDEVLKQTKKGSRVIHSSYSWDHVVVPYYNRIMELINNV